MAPVRLTIFGGSATGEVWVDANANGLLDSGESGLPGVTVHLVTTLGTIAATTTTNASGVYNFNFLLPNTSYAIQVEQPAGYIFTFFQSGNNTAINSFTGSNGMTNIFEVAAGWTVTLNCGVVALAGLPASTIAGPGAVPGNSSYMYTIALTGQPFVTWATEIVSPVDPPGNTITVGTMLNTYSEAANTTLDSIPLTFGNSGPADIILKALVNGQVISTQEIYVVQVSVAYQDDLHYSSNGPQNLPVTPDPNAPGIAVKTVVSATPGTAAANWTATVTLTGPGDNLGVNQINVGFIQHITIQSWSGQYALLADSPSGTPTRQVNSLQGETFLDMLPDGGGAPGPNSSYTTGPWYDRQAGATISNAGLSTAIIRSADAPGLPLPVIFDQFIWAQINAIVNADGVNGYNNDQRRLTQISLLAQYITLATMFRIL